MTPIVLVEHVRAGRPGRSQGLRLLARRQPDAHARSKACLAALEGAQARRRVRRAAARRRRRILLTLKSGDHVLVGDDVYGGTFRIFDKVMKQFGLEATFIDMSDPAQRASAAMRPNTQLVWLETPSNPMLKIFDIAAIAEIAQDGGRRARRRQHVRDADAPAAARARRDDGRALDDEVPERPLRRRRRRGHDERRRRSPSGCASSRRRWAACPSPFDCYMVLRGLKTLGVRMRQHVAERARSSPSSSSRHAQVARVLLPGPRHRTRGTRSPRGR